MDTPPKLRAPLPVMGPGMDLHTEEDKSAPLVLSFLFIQILYLCTSHCSHADNCRCRTAAFQLKMLRMSFNVFSGLNSFFGHKNLTMLQAPEYSARTHDVKMHRHFAPEIQKRQVHKITVLKKNK